MKEIREFKYEKIIKIIFKNSLFSEIKNKIEDLF